MYALIGITQIYETKTSKNMKNHQITQLNYAVFCDNRFLTFFFFKFSHKMMRNLYDYF